MIGGLEGFCVVDPADFGAKCGFEYHPCAYCGPRSGEPASFDSLSLSCVTAGYAP